MLPKKNRLSAGEVREVFAFNEKSSSSTFFKILKKLKVNSLKFAVIVPGSVSKSAVKRNYLRRKFFSALKDIYKDPEKGWYVIILRKEAEKKSQQEIEKYLEKTLKN